MRIPADEFRHRLLPIGLAQGIGLVCGIIGVRLSSHLVAPADLGRYGVFMTLAPVGIWVVFAGLNKLVNRAWASTPHRGVFLRRLAGSGRRRLPWLAGFAVILTVSAAPPHPLFFGAALFVASLALTVTQLTQATLQADRRHWPDFGVATTVSLGRTFLPLAAYAFVGATSDWLIGGFLAHSLVAALLCVTLLRRPWQADAPGASAPPADDAVFLGPMFTVLALVGWGMSGLLRWLTAGFYGAEAAGYFTLAANVAGIIPGMLGTVLIQYLQPGWFAKGDAGVPPADLCRATDRAAAGYTVGALVLTGLLHFLMPVLVGPLVSERYATVTTLVLPVGCFATALMTGSFFHVLLLTARREQACGPADLTGAAILASGAFVGAWAGWDWLLRWLLVSPLIPWLVNRPLARRALVKAA